MRKLLLPLIAAPSLALASGYSLPNTNPRDLAMSASAVAAQIDSGAAFALPASLSRLDGSSARLSAGGVVIFDTWSDPTGASPDVEIDKKVTPLGSLSVAYGGRVGDRGWGVGLAVQPFGGAVVTWPGDWPGRYRIVEVDRQVFSGVLTGGVEVLPARAARRRARVLLHDREALPGRLDGALQPDPGDPSTWPPDATGTIDVNGGALSFDVSAEVQPLPDLPLTIAVDYKHKATQELDGDVSWENLPPGALFALGAGVPQAQILADQGAGQTLTIPNTLNVGVAYRVSKPLLLTATYTFDRWVVYDEDVFVGDNGAQIAVERNYSNGYTIRAGAEYDVAPTLQVRAGVQRDVSGLDTDHYSPTLPDASSWAGSLGATYKFGGGLSVDAAVFYAMMDEVTATNTGNEPPASYVAEGSVVPTRSFRGTYDVSALVFGVSLGWTPGAK